MGTILLLELPNINRTATTILAAVKTALSNNGANAVTLVGHSLGMLTVPTETC